MFAFMENLKIGTRIALALVLPIVGLLIFSGLTVLDKRQFASEIEDVHMLTLLAPEISALVHELQKERGTSAVFIGSKGTKFAAELPAQKKITNEKRTALADTLKTFNTASFGAPPWSTR